MNRSFYLVLIVCTLLILASCSAPVGTVSSADDSLPSAVDSAIVSSPSSVDSAPQSSDSASSAPLASSDLLNQYGDAYWSRLRIDDAPVDLSDLRAVDNVYIAPLIPSVFFYAWASPSEIKADDLICICAQYNLLNLPTDVEGVYLPEYFHAPAEQVEAALQKHFDVSSEYLKTSEWYEYGNVKNTYGLVVGGGGYWPQAISAKQDGNQIIIETGMFALEDMSLTPCGTLTVELDNKNVVKYISYQIDEAFHEEYKNWGIADEY